MQGSTDRRRAIAMLMVTVVAMPTVVLGMLGVLVGLVWLGLLVGLAVGVGVAVWADRRAEATVLRSVGARPAPESEFRRYHNLVDGLCVTSGVPKPALWVIDDPAANALAVGRTSQRAALVLTTGMLEGLPRIELEGVLASLLGQIRAGDTATASLLAALVSPLAPLGGAAAALVRRFAEPDLQTRSDVAACRMTRYPPGMIAALDRLAHTDTRPRRQPPSVASMWLVPPTTTPDVPSLDERIAMLREL